MVEKLTEEQEDILRLVVAESPNGILRDTVFIGDEDYHIIDGRIHDWYHAKESVLLALERNGFLEQFFPPLLPPYLYLLPKNDRIPGFRITPSGEEYVAKYIMATEKDELRLEKRYGEKESGTEIDPLKELISTWKQVAENQWSRLDLADKRLQIAKDKVEEEISLKGSIGTGKAALELLFEYDDAMSEVREAKKESESNGEPLPPEGGCEDALYRPPIAGIAGTAIHNCFTRCEPLLLLAPDEQKDKK